MRIFTILLLCVGALLACKCKDQSTKESFCKAHWVSHVKVKARVGKQGLPEGSTRKGLNNLRYHVEHLDVFKKPENMTQLPEEIFTPSETPACGIKIDAGKEYLLAGRVETPSALFTVICGQVLSDNPAENQYENVLQWQNVPQSLRSQLSSIKC
ncbi:unnamed protein product [Caenorhabditis auriculariae]|uniref:NTR domain-containing protein n=1 Tax=Caenorhabditis auriculariae TaxID=2777116 RepID=A0A8S1GTH6_9PELO|nr:unnamed protein product [Caenorhabditis auriculariae]